MSRRLVRSARALSVLTIAAASALTHAQTLPAPPPATQPTVAPVAAPATLPATGPATLPAATQAAIAPATGPAGTQPAATQPISIVGTPASHPAQNISLEFKDVPIDTVLDYLSEKAGFIVSKESPLEGRVSITSRGKVSAAEALTLLNAALNKPNGYSAIRSGRILRVGKRSDFKREDIPVQSGSDPEAVPETYDLVTWVIPLKNVDATKLKTELQPLISSDADFTANAGSNSLILTDTCANIRRIVSIVSKLDQQQAMANNILIKQLTFASASAAAKLITAIFAPDGAENAQGGGGGQQGRGRRFFQMMMGAGGPGGPGGPGGGGAGGQDSGKASGKVTAAADDRTNTIIVVGPVATLDVIKQILETLDNDKTPGSEVKVFQMEFADATSAAKLINTIFQSDQTSSGGGQRGGGGDGPGGRIQNFEGLTPSDRNVKVNAAAADHTNTLVVTAPPDTLKYISNILEQLDKDPAAMSEVKVFQLKYADSASAAKLISSVFLTEPSQQQQGGGGPGGQQQQHLPAIGNLSTSLHGGRVNAVSDDRTNTLVVTAPKDAMAIVTGILEKLDSNPSAESALFIYHLRNGIAQDIQTTLNSLFSNGTNSGSTGAAGNRNSGNSLLGSGLGSSQGFGGGIGGGVGGGGGRGGLGGNSFGSGSGGNFGQPLSSSGAQRSSGTAGGAAGGANIRATSELVGQVIVVADIDTNSLLVSTASRYREQVKKIIAELDRPIPQVLIKVLVVEVTHDRTNDLGIDFSILDQRASGKGITVGQNNGNIVAAGQTPSGLVVGLMETQLNSTLHALAVDNKLDVLSRPYILASDNQPASITIGQEVPFITNTQITETGQQINTVTYQAVGIILNVTPHINPDGAVTLDVAPEISAISAQTVPIGNGINAPVIDNRSAQSRVTIRNGNTIVIGGMMQDQKTVTQTKIPLLGDIPWLGALFTRYQTDRSKTELLIFLTPHIAPQPDALDGMSKDEMKTTNITETAVEPGEFKKHFDNMQRGKNPTPATTQSAAEDITPTPSTQPFHGDIIAPAPGDNRNRPGMRPGK